MQPKPEYPTWICVRCAGKYGEHDASIITRWYNGGCDVCGKQTLVTEPKNYGQLTPDWRNERR